MQPKNLLNTVILLGITLALLFFLFESDKTVLTPDSSRYSDLLGNGEQAFYPMPENIPLDNGKVQLGRRLFFDSMLSPEGRSCAACHVDEEKPVKLQHDVPSLLNVGFNQYFGWTGYHDSLAEKLDHEINDELRMKSNWNYIVDALSSATDYPALFEKHFPAGLTEDTVQQALIEYLYSLTSRLTDFDRYLLGDEQAISEDQKSGLRLFTDYGCVACHQGINLGGNLRTKLGLAEPPVNSENEFFRQFNEGLYLQTGNSADRYVFKVPGLRNVVNTAPYFHEGIVDSLEDAVRYMARMQLGVNAPDEDVLLIVEFLKSLSDKPAGDSE